MEEIQIPEGGTVVRSQVATECPCGTEIAQCDFAVQLFGLPVVYCFSCGIDRIVGAPPGPSEDVGESFDLVGALTADYSLRQQLGWATPPAVLHVDPELGLTWRVGADEGEVDNCMGRGRLVGDRLEVTLYHSLTHG